MQELDRKFDKIVKEKDSLVQKIEDMGKDGDIKSPGGIPNSPSPNLKL